MLLTCPSFKIQFRGRTQKLMLGLEITVWMFLFLSITLRSWYRETALLCGMSVFQYQFSCQQVDELVSAYFYFRIFMARQLFYDFLISSYRKILLKIWKFTKKTASVFIYRIRKAYSPCIIFTWKTNFTLYFRMFYYQIAKSVKKASQYWSKCTHQTQKNFFIIVWIDDPRLKFDSKSKTST